MQLSGSSMRWQSVLAEASCQICLGLPLKTMQLLMEVEIFNAKKDARPGFCSCRAWPYTFSQSGLPLHCFFCRPWLCASSFCAACFLPGLALCFFSCWAWPSASFSARPARFFFCRAWPCTSLPAGFGHALAPHFCFCRAWASTSFLLFLPGLALTSSSNATKETFILMQEETFADLKRSHAAHNTTL